ncbi:Nicotinate-nucleotide adenylyltransferase [Botrimarina colliarenosi]|uniref:Probable nicotinate-nucleotide adenylyltransferase n=1 Tax=Botrimarina colliarenosi TaxID=2528001 RepID=A0A5C6ANR3_9BACT|nr:nicotinate-nucleotide adenylyltransferase [Botrimarina colliarenosi]TWT99803.1 Nicotinate-nucleotide adenylyltransferase [Botrimarina colliarenosi]
MRLGLFGGSFDPVHNGHLALAACCAEQGQLDAVWLIPAAVQPLKPDGPVAADADRVAMLRLATEGQAGREVSTIEIDRGGVSYTVDTLRQMRGQLPDAELFFLMGADTLRDFSSWREPAEVLRLARPMVVQRPGEGGVATEVPHLRIDMPPMAVSSSDLRRRIAAGESIVGLVPDTVAEYIARHGLYR